MTNTTNDILMVASEFPPYIRGGLGVHVHAIVEFMQHHFKVRLMLPMQPGYNQSGSSLRIQEVSANSSATDVAYWIDFCSSCVNAFQKDRHQPLLIHCHDWMTVLAGIKLRRLTGRPLVFNVHLPQSCGVPMELENLGLAAADLVLVNSLAVQRELAGRKIALKRIEIIPNGVNTAVFSPSAERPTNEPYLLFVGRLTLQKGVEILLHAFRALHVRCPDVRLVIVGDGELELYLKRVTRFLGIAHKVAFEGWQTGSLLVHRYQHAIGVVVPSLYEPFGIVALEGMACGRPVVASRVGGLQEIIQHGIQGLLFRSGDYLELATHLAALMLLGPEREQMGKAGRAQALRFSWTKAGQMTLAAYSQVMSAFAIRPWRNKPCEFPNALVDLGPSAVSAIRRLVN